MFAASKTASASGGYQISRSLRFNSADSAYLSKTPASAGNRRTWTFSTWVKRSQLNSGNAMLATVNGSALNYFAFGTSTGDFLAYAYFDGSTDIFGVNTSNTSVFRDVSAWYHIVLYVDTTQATASNRVKIYVNNVEQTLGGTYPTQNYDTPINNSIPNLIGGGTGSYTAYLADQYMTEINFIDGQALTPSSFGQTDPQTGVWSPALYRGSYGTNGFYLNFSDNSNTTAATLGKDYSGNGNNWTPNNFSVTAGAGNDSLVDSPTSYGTDTGVGGEVRGNYCTWNPISTTSTLTNGNLDFSVGATTAVKSSLYVPSGKWYFEITPTAITGTSIGEISINDSNGNIAVGYRSTGTKDVDSYSTNAAYGATWAVGDIIGVAFDVDNKQVTFYKNGTSQGAITYTGSALTANTMGVQVDWRTSATFAGTANFGQRPFAYTAPSGYKALCTQNLPTPTIGATNATLANAYFNPVIYTGTGSSLGVTGVGFQPDLVWVKSRSAATDHAWYDAVRGVQKQIESNTTTAETTETTGLTAFGSDGFTTGALAQMNTSSATYVAWNWKANGSGSTNTSGSITSTVSANTTSGFSVVTYTGSGVAGTIGHGLGVAPSVIIVKSRSAAGDWPTYHISLGNGNYILFNTLDTTASSSTIWNSTSPTSSVFSVGINTNSNTVTVTYVAYCFAPIAGYSVFGSYTGNGSTNFIYTGFRPAFVLIRRTNIAAGSGILDSVRNTFNSANKSLNANVSDAEGVGTAGSQYVDLLSNGFKCLDSSAGFNASGDNYIYMAFASNPFKYSLAR